MKLKDNIYFRIYSSRFINFLFRKIFSRNDFLKKSPNEISVALCCIVKNENDYLREYVDHYLKLGFNKIFIYDNNDKQGENPSDLFLNNTFVDVVNVRGMKNVQFASYNDCLTRHRQEYDWIAFFDADEFLILHKHKTIQDYLSQDVFQGFDSVRINWRNFNDNGLLGNEDNFNRQLVSRFLDGEKASGRQSLTKVILRSENAWAKFINPHYASFSIRSCNANGTEIDPDCPRCTQNWDSATLNHYRKTIIEFIEHKYNRGFADYCKVKTDFDWFFEYSEKTPQKLAIAEKFLKGSA